MYFSGVKSAVFHISYISNESVNVLDSLKLKVQMVINLWDHNYKSNFDKPCLFETYSN